MPELSSAAVSSQVRAPIERFASELARDVPGRPWERLVARPAVSVIIPIFNAADALSACLRSIRAAGTPESTEIVLVDDHSSDPAIQTVCRDFARTWPRTVLLRNARNLGFVSTVNYGIRESAPENDVLLLNSDTEVTPGWLPRMSIAAHLDRATASVCAVSNAAGVFSVPRAHEDRELPDGVTPAMAQRVLGFVSERALETVPSTSGFCMLIKRAAIERVGHLDDRLFLRGYGEENDWNERAAEAGFVHRVDDSRFVAHTRGLSFGSAKEQLKRKNSRILQALHPQHVERLRAWEKRDPLSGVRERYGALVERLRTGPAAERAAFFDAPVTLAIGSAPAGGAWSERERRISVACASTGEIEVDLYGVARAHVRRASLRECLFELAHRWDPTRITAQGPQLLEPAAEVARLFGVELSTTLSTEPAR